MDLDPDCTVAALLDRHPWLLDRLVAHGFQPLSNPAIRRVMAHRTTLREACERHGLDLDTLLAALRVAAPAETP